MREAAKRQSSESETSAASLSCRVDGPVGRHPARPRAGSARALGEELVFGIEIQSTADAPQNLMIDYIVHHRKAKGKLVPKVFNTTLSLRL